jgi:AcrR family transcriptional regulator
MAKRAAKLARDTDQRVRRTRDRLGTALITLIQEKPFEAVTVQNVLDRAHVGRSTFYLHYRDKNDLLLSQLEMFSEMMSRRLTDCKEKSNRVMPVEELFAHIRLAMPLYGALKRADRLDDFFELAEGNFARGIEKRLLELKRLPDSKQRELAACSVALAGNLLALLRWWLDRGAKETPRSMDEMFHKMVWKGLQ